MQCKGVQGCRGRGSESEGSYVDRGRGWVELGAQLPGKAPWPAGLIPSSLRVEDGLDRTPCDDLVSMESKGRKLHS